MSYLLVGGAQQGATAHLMWHPWWLAGQCLLQRQPAQLRLHEPSVLAKQVKVCFTDHALSLELPEAHKEGQEDVVPAEHGGLQVLVHVQEHLPLEVEQVGVAGIWAVRGPGGVVLGDQSCYELLKVLEAGAGAVEGSAQLLSCAEHEGGTPCERTVGLHEVVGAVEGIVSVSNVLLCRLLLALTLLHCLHDARGLQQSLRLQHSRQHPLLQRRRNNTSHDC